jgi:hypothetical protein
MSIVPVAAAVPPAARRGPVMPVAYGLAAGTEVDAGAGRGLDIGPASVAAGGTLLDQVDEACRCRLRCFFFFLLATGD